MHNGTRNLIVDSAEQPNYIPDPQFDPVGYDYYGERHEQHREHRRERRTEWRVLLLGFVLVLIVFFVCFLVARAFIEYRYETDESFRQVVNLGMDIATLVLFLSIAAVFAFLAGAVWNLAVKSGIVKLPGGAIAHVIDLATDWRRPGSRRLAQWSIDRHFGVQEALANKSIYRNVTTYSPSVHYDYRSDMELGEHTTGAAISIPTFNELIATGQIGGDEGLVLGIGGDDE